MLNRRWLRGGFPSAYLARTHSDGFVWLESFIRTFVERDLAELGVRIPSTTMRRFWTMLAHWHAQTWNSSEFARSFGVADTAVRHYLDVLSDTLVVRQLRPWHANISKRQVKAPKVYIRDSGLLHALLEIDTQKSLLSHPKLGASWEGLMIELIIDHLDIARDNCYFWATHTDAELDLYVSIKRKTIGFEIKRTSSPKVTPSMRSALADLKLDELIVIHAGAESYPLARKIGAVSSDELIQELKRF